LLNNFYKIYCLNSEKLHTQISNFNIAIGKIDSLNQLRKDNTELVNNSDQTYNELSEKCHSLKLEMDELKE
jgi:hypothetical protein